MTDHTASLTPINRPRMHARVAVGLAAALLIVQAVMLDAWPRSAALQPIPAEQARLRLNPNDASAAELQLLPQVGPAIAQNIIAYRESVAQPPAFRCPEDLDRVKRIGPVTVERLRPYLAFPDDSGRSGTRQEQP